MKNEDTISKHKMNKLVLLLAVIFLVSAAGLGGIYAWRTINNSSGNGDNITNQSANAEGEAALDENGMPEDGTDITETKTAGDVKTLRELLLEDGKFAINLTDDIRIERSFLVNGTKKLVGDKSITMELYAEPFQPILKVQQGATLILDGVTLDGNSNASGVEVDKKAGFTSLSGTILYPIPYGVRSYGTTRIKDIKIDGGIDSGLCVMEDSKAYMEGGEIIGCSKAAVHVVTGGYVHVSGDAKLTDSYMCINNRGTCEITGGVLSDAWRSLIWNLAELTINYEGETKNDKLEWYNAGEIAIRSGVDSTTYINGLYVHDAVKGGIKGINHEGLVVKNCKVENVGTYGVESAKGRKNAVFTDIEVINAKNSGVRVYGEHKVEVTNVTVTNTEGRGIQNGNSHVIAKNIKIVNSAKSGIYGGKGSITEVDNTEILSSKKYGIENYAGTMTIKDATITDVALSGVIAKKETVTNLSNVTIVKPAKRGIMNLGGTMTADKITVESPGQYGVTSTLTDKVVGSLTVTNLTVNNVLTDNALNCHATVVTAKNVNISGAGGYGVRVTGGGTMNVTDVKIKDCGSRGMGSSNKNSVLNVTNAEIDSTGMSGVIAGAESIVNLENVIIKNSGLTSGTDTDYTFSYRGGLSTTDGTINAKNVTISDSVGSGICVNGGTLNAEKIVVNNAGENGVYSTSSKTYGEAVVRIDGLKVNDAKNRGVYNNGGTVTLSDVNIKNPKNYGVTTAAYSKDYAGSVTIKGLKIRGVQKKNALNCNASQMTVAKGTICDVPEYGAYVLKDGNLTLTNVTFTDVTKRGVWSEAATAILKNVEVTGAQYGVFVDGGTTTFHGGKVTEAGIHGIYVTSANKGLATADIKAVTIHEATERGVYNYGGNTTLTDVTITDPGTYGVSTGKANWTVGEETTTFGGKVTATNLTVAGVKKNNALNCNASEIEMTGGSLSNVAQYGAYAVSGGKLTLKGVNISKTGLSGVYAKTGADVALTTIVIDQVGITEDTEKSYEYQDKSGIGASEATVKAENVTITNVAEDGIYIAGCTSTLKGIQIQTAKYGLFMDGGTITEESKDVEIDGVTASGVYIKTTKEYGEAVANIENLTVDGAAKRAVYNIGAKITLTGTTIITNSGEYGITSGKANWTVGEATTTFAGKVTATDLTVTGVKKNNALHCNASEIEVTGGTLSNIKECAVRVVGNGKTTLSNVAIAHCEKAAISVQKGTATMTGGTITGTTGYDVDLAEPNGDASATLIGVSITRAEGNTQGSMIIARGKDNDENEYSGISTVTLDNCNLTGSGTPTTEPAITVTKGTLNIQNGGTYTNNVSQKSGGVIYVAEAGNVNINQSETKSLVSFTNNGCNSGASASSGGVINVQNGGTFKADTCAFTNNYVKCSGTGTCTGGAISVGSKTDGDVVIKNATFDGNHIDATKSYGGAVSVGTDCYLTMENCVFGQTTTNVANYGKDIRGANSTVFNLSGKIVAEFFNTQYVYTLRVVDDLAEDSNIVMKWNQNKISNVEEQVVIRFANSDLVTKSNKSCFALHEIHESTHKFAFGSTIGKIRKK